MGYETVLQPTTNAPGWSSCHSGADEFKLHFDPIKAQQSLNAQRGN